MFGRRKTHLQAESQTEAGLRNAGIEPGNPRILLESGYGVRPMAMKDTIIKKLQQATCDKTELNKKVVRWQKSLKEAEKALTDGGKKKKEGK